MVITRTPFRISFFGGGTDYPIWYEENGGAVISTTIDKYCYITCRYLPPFFDHKYRIRYMKREEVRTVNEIQHPSVRECLKFLNVAKGIEMVHTSDLPALSGIGSSSSFTVGFLNALHSLDGKMTTKRQLALDAINIEQNFIKENVGSQDQAAAAFGGLNRIEFGGPHRIAVHPLPLKTSRLASLESYLMLFFTGFSRNASEIAAEQIKKTSEKKKELHEMRALVEEAQNILMYDDRSLEEFGGLLHEGWKLKRNLTSKITTPFIDEIYAAARAAGATGGKLLGAGGGGFILFFVKPELQPNVKEQLKRLLYVPFHFETLGSQVIYYAPANNF